jgi:membrane-bound lytic murein transglycosylase D
MKTNSLLACLAFFILTSHNPATAQTADDVVPDQLALAEEDLGPFAQALDDLYIKWYVDKSAAGKYRVDSLRLADHPEPTDEIYLARIDTILSAIPLSYNHIVRAFIELYTVKRREQVAAMLGLSEHYFPIFEQALEREGLPQELKYLPVIESALDPRARSKAGACGLWQFITPTAKLYKLEITSSVDERRDPLRSSQIAARYLKDLYAIYNDWLLVIAAYNCGPANVNKAIRRAGGQKNYWNIYYHLPRETRGYVPAFIAAIYVFNYHAAHGIHPVPHNLPTMCDSIVLTRSLHFDQVSQLLGISNEELRDLNPQYIRDVVPAGFGRAYALRLPYNHVGPFIDNQDTIFAHRRAYYFNNNDRTVNPRDRVRVHAPTPPKNAARVTYAVKNGDVLGTIAERFNVKLADLRYWNNITGNIIRVGQKLSIYVPQDKLAFYQARARSGNSSTSSPSPSPTTPAPEFATYTIKPGDNLWSIARKFPGVTNQDIMKWNDISPEKAGLLKPGQKLKIKK